MDFHQTRYVHCVDIVQICFKIAYGQIVHFWQSYLSAIHPYFTITKTRLFKYIENFSSKTLNFQIKNCDIFHISAQNMDCGYSLEPPRRGGSNEYPQSMFWAEMIKITYTPANPSFTI